MNIHRHRQNAQLTTYDCQSRIKNGHGIMSMITATNMPGSTTHLLWSPKQDPEQTWDHQHEYRHQHARKHNSPPMITKAGSRIDMRSSAWSQPPTCQDAQLTGYDCQSRIQNRHEIISMITATNMPGCTTHRLWLPEQDQEWTWDHQHDHSHQHARMHNSPAMIAKGNKEWTWDHQHDQNHQHARMHNPLSM